MDHVQVDPEGLSQRERYRLLTACLIPRPIAWVSTLDPGGAANLAPFSFFGGVTSDPPTVMLSVGRRRGAPKDTARNLRATGDCVIHIPDRRLAERMVRTSADVPPEVDEIELVGMTPHRAVRVRAPRLAEAAIAFEAEVRRHLEVGNSPVDLFLLEVLLVHLASELLDKDGLPDAARLRAVGRLGGERYLDSTRPFEIARPAPPAAARERAPEGGRDGGAERGRL